MPAGPSSRPSLGWCEITDPGGKQYKVEYDTIMCNHCQRVICVKPGTGQSVYLYFRKDLPVLEVDGAFCIRCMHPICPKCCEDGRCQPWERQIEEIEARDRMLRGMGIGV